MMMNGMMDGSIMMWGMFLIWLLVIVLLVLSIAALVKYVFLKDRSREPDGGTSATPPANRTPRNDN